MIHKTHIFFNYLFPFWSFKNIILKKKGSHLY